MADKRNVKARFFATVVAAGFVLALAGCGEEGVDTETERAAEEFQESAGEALDAAGEAAADMTERAGELAEEAGRAMQEAAGDAGDDAEEEIDRRKD